MLIQMNEEQKIAIVSLNDIDTTLCLMRSAKRQEMKFKELKASIKKNGVKETVLVRINPDTSSSKTYSLIDGLQRYTASLELGRDSIPVLIEDHCSEERALA